MKILGPIEKTFQFKKHRDFFLNIFYVFHIIKKDDTGSEEHEVSDNGILIFCFCRVPSSSFSELRVTIKDMRRESATPFSSDD